MTTFEDLLQELDRRIENANVVVFGASNFVPDDVARWSTIDEHYLGISHLDNDFWKQRWDKYVSSLQNTQRRAIKGITSHIMLYGIDWN